MQRKCQRQDCNRPAVKGWTHCKRHYSAGRYVFKSEEKEEPYNYEADDIAFDTDRENRFFGRR